MTLSRWSHAARRSSLVTPCEVGRQPVAAVAVLRRPAPRLPRCLREQGVDDRGQRRSGLDSLGDAGLSGGGEPFRLLVVPRRVAWCSWNLASV